MKKLILIICVLFSLSACNNSTPNFKNHQYQIRNLSGGELIIHVDKRIFNEKFSENKLSFTSVVYLVHEGKDTETYVVWGDAFNDSTVIFEVGGKFYEEKSETGYSILNKEAYVMIETFEALGDSSHGRCEFAITKDYLLSLPEIENTN